jgi:hypothetical protein
MPKKPHREGRICIFTKLLRRIDTPQTKNPARLSPFDPMNPLRLTLAAFSSAILLIGACNAQNSPTPQTQPDPFKKSDVPLDKDPRVPIFNFVVTLEVYEMAPDDGTKLLLNDATDEQRYAKTLQLEQQGKARLGKLVAGVVEADQSIKIEQQDNMPYTVSFNLPKSEDTINWRKLGYGLVMRPRIAPDGSKVEVTKSFDCTRLMNFRNIPVQSVANAPTESVIMPCFDPQSLAGSDLYSLGKVAFLGTFNRHSDNGVPGVDPWGIVFARVVKSEIESEPSIPVPNLVSVVQFNTYSVNREKARELLAKPLDHGSLYQAVQALVATNEAKLEHFGELRALDNIETSSNDSYELAIASNRSAYGVIRNIGWMEDVTVNSFYSVTDLELKKLEWMHNLGPLQVQGKPPAMNDEVLEDQSISTRLYAKLGEQQFVGTISPPGDTGLNGKKDSGQEWLQFVHVTQVTP